MSTQQPTVRTSSRKGLNNSVLGTRNLMTVAALAVVGAIIVVPLTYIGAAWSTTPNGVLAACALMGVWVVPYALPPVVIRRPGAAVIAGFIMGIITAFSHPMGPAAIAGNVIGALYIEIPLALMLYRKWTWWSFGIAGTVFGFLNGLAYAVAIVQGASTTMQIAFVAIAVVSAWIGVAVTVLIGRLLNQAGVAIAWDGQ
ncbi:MAG: ECF transporter S component [Actinomycetaceae bacterium]|nr:ECF transporter S component [Actinomycetaceae bacterium]